MDIDKAYEVEQGLLVENGPFYTGGASSPVGLDLPTRTLYLQDSASGVLIWRKFGAGVNDWRQLSAQDILFNISGLTTNSPDFSGITQAQQAIAALANRDFGKGFGVAFTAGNFQTTSSAFQTIQTVSPSTFTNGDYLAISYGRYQKTLIAGQIETRFLLNGSTEFSQDEISLDDDDFFFGHTSVAYMPGLTTSPTVNFQFRKSDGGGNIQAENRLLLLWRVA